MQGRRGVPGWYWAVALLALIWEGIGCYFYLAQVRMTGADLAALPAAQAEAFGAMSTWQWSVFAIAVWVGLAGAVGLLLRMRWAPLAFAMSLIAALIQYGYSFAATPILQRMSLAEALPLPVAIIVIGALLLWFASRSKARGWLG